MRETDLVQQARLEASKLGYTLFRNNSGSLQDKNGRWVQFGLCVGSADLIGWKNSTGQFTAVELKVPGKNPTPAQQHFIDTVIAAGGIAGVVRCMIDLHSLLK